MTQQTKTRCYSVTMAILNGSVTFFLFLMSKMNADAGWPNVLISIFGPAMTILFLSIALAWMLDALRPGAMRPFVPGGEESNDSVLASLCQQGRAPTPLPPSLGERWRSGARRLAGAPAHALSRLRRPTA
jgi:hypothetical protein